MQLTHQKGGAYPPVFLIYGGTMGNNATIRLAAQLCCISDYFITGQMNREADAELTAEQCVQAIRLLGSKCQDENFLKKEHAESAWATYTKGKAGIGVKEMMALDNVWNFKTAAIEYKSTKFDLLAVEKLRQLFVFNGGDMYQMSETLGFYRWSLMDSMKYKERIPRPLRNILTEHLNPAEELTWQEIRAELDEARHKPALNARAKNLEEV